MTSAPACSSRGAGCAVASRDAGAGAARGVTDGRAGAVDGAEAGAGFALDGGAGSRTGFGVGLTGAGDPAAPLAGRAGLEAALAGAAGRGMIRSRVASVRLGTGRPAASSSFGSSRAAADGRFARPCDRPA